MGLINIQAWIIRPYTHVHHYTTIQSLVTLFVGICFYFLLLDIYIVIFLFIPTFFVVVTQVAYDAN